MTQVDFHVNVTDKIAYACRLVRKVRAAGHRVVVQSDDEAALARFDLALWSFAPLEFIPHVRANDRHAARTPVLLANGDSEFAHYEVLVNLGSATPSCFTRFERLLEETLHECVVKLGGLLDKLLTKCLGLILQISRNLKILAGSVLVLEMIVLHLEDIDESVE